MFKKLLPVFAFMALTLPLAAQSKDGGTDKNSPGQVRQRPEQIETMAASRNVNVAVNPEMSAEEAPGGVKGTVVSRAGRVPVANAEVLVYSGVDLIGARYTSSDGTFSYEGLSDGHYMLKISAPGFMVSQVNVSIEGFVKDLVMVSIVPSSVVADIDESNFADFDMDDSGYENSPSIIYGNDIFTSIASYDFSAVRFKNRGYNSESQDVYLSGVKMNDAITGYSPWSLWSGLNEAMRGKESTLGLDPSDVGVGGVNGVTNLLATPSHVRKGFRFSALTNSALYRLRLMASYASGESDNGWSYAFNVSARLGGNDWVDGVYYRSFAYYAGVEKKFNDVHRLGLVIFATPGQRGAQNASTQEVYDLTGDNMYNSNWGYQAGKMRNSRVRKTHEPVMFLKYTATPSDRLEATATLLYRTGKNGYTALDWYDAPDPRPDYYRNLPSYFYMDNPDYDRVDLEKSAWAREAWQYDLGSTRRINWDRLYNVNYNNVGADGSKRSKYAVEERRVDQNDVNLAGTVKWRARDWFTLNGGLNLKWNRTEYYKKMDDLLGGDYYVNIDQFAERDFASSPTMIQNDLDYFLKNGSAQRIGQGDKYGYDYYAHVRNANLWLTGNFETGNFKGYVALEGGYSAFWREGLVRKGLFAGLDDDGKEIVYDNKVITSYDSYGNVITSKGKSEVADFFAYKAKIGASYFIPGGHRVYANVGYMTDAPTFAQAFVSPRTRNTMVADLKVSKTFSADLNYQFSKNGYDVRVTGFYTKINDQTDLMSFYDDSQNSFTNFAMSGIDQRHAGLEVGFKIPVVKWLAVQGVVSYGQYVYTSTPRMTQTVDNSATVVFENERIPYWASHPVFKKETVNGITSYVKDENGDYVVEKNQKHFVPSTPQLAASLGLDFFHNYWFADLNVNYFGNSYLDMNPLYRTDMATAGPDKTVTPSEIEYMASQEKFDPVFLLNASVGKSWYINRKYNIGFSLEVRNILNNRGVKTGGYEQTRLIDSKSGERFYRFDSKYFYMSGVNYMLNLYFRF